MKQTNSTIPTMAPKGLRPLKSNEVVRRGDFVEDGHQGFELWEGPGGFRADAFVKRIYRQIEHHLSGASQSL